MIDDDPNPEALAEQALQAYSRSEYANALRLFTTAREGFQSLDQKRRAAEMSNNICVCLLELNRAQEALVAVEDTPTVFRETGERLLEAQAYGNRAMASAVLGRSEAAQRDYRSAARLFRDLGDEEGLQYTMQALSKLQLEAGQPMQALDSMQSAMSSRKGRSWRDRMLSWLFNLPRRLFGR